MSGFCEPPPQGTSPIREGNDWLYRMGQFLCRLLPLPISQGGTGQTTAQSAINALTQVASATAGYVLTKNSTTGNADWEPGGGGGGAVSSVSSTDPALTISPTTGAVVASANNFVGDSGSGGVHGVVPAPAAGDAAADKFLKADGTWATTPAGTGTVTSVALTAPAEFSVSGSPVTTSGTLAITKATETANTVWAGPTTGAAAQPTFRALVTADMPAGTGTVTSVAMTVPAEFLVSGSPITTSGTLAITKATETANTVWAGPTTGSPATPTFRGLVTADMPAGTGTVTSIATSAPITGGTITTTGTIGINNFTGDSGSGGAAGAVPGPAAGDSAAGKFLAAGGGWAVPPGTASGGALHGQAFTTPGANTFNVPTGVTSVWVTMIGGGGGGSCTIAAATGGGGGGAGELVQNLQCLVVSGGTVTVTIGAKGTGGAASSGSAQAGVAGGDTSFGATFVAKGGSGGNTNGTSGAGGGPGGNASKGVGNPGVSGALGSPEAPTYFGGASGGGGGNTTGSNGGNGGPAGGYLATGSGSTASTQAGGGGGANTIWGVGGAGGNGGAIGNSAASTSYGAGGGGGGGHATTTIGGGDGAPGYCLVQWVG